MQWNWWILLILHLLKGICISYLMGLLRKKQHLSLVNFLNTYGSSPEYQHVFWQLLVPFCGITSLCHLQDEVEQTVWIYLHVHKILSLGFSECFQPEDMSLPIRADSSELCLAAYLTFRKSPAMTCWKIKAGRGSCCEMAFVFLVVYLIIW